MKQDILRGLPSIDELMNSEGVAQLTQGHDRDTVVSAVRAVVDELRSEIVHSDSPDSPGIDISVDAIARRVVSRIDKKFTQSLRHAINAAGIVLHTGLGRAMLPEAAVDAVHDAIRGYCTLATDLDTGQRGSRDIHFSDLLCELTGAQAGTIVNNNAAATMIILNTLAKGKEVIVSRGQLVEIGGSFRMPEVMETSGAILREVGATNKTHLRDYRNAINENTGAILHVHMSNYRIVGFFEEPGIGELVALGREHDIPVIDDLGSGALVDLSAYGLEAEPMIRESISVGADVVCFSGDKLIGGPQAGVIVGKAPVIGAIKKNPLARAFRVGKMEVAALEATLRLFLDRGKLHDSHPTYRMLSLTVDDIAPRVHAVADQLNVVGLNARIAVEDGASQVGSGSVPAQTLPSKLLSVRPVSTSASALAKKLRYCHTPIFARIRQDAVLFDFRTIQPNEDQLVVDALKEVLGEAHNP